ncbi:MAG TPA: translesion error-prone DNA polymerase V autoproteolytic subunit [Ramlibacter sp.]|nr:translesion error-prone DNA polymerase V autoproteolytic subunit [Ramlibacter sp.]
MTSSTAHAPWPFVPAPPLYLPMASGTVRAGFPSPADDFSAKRHDLNDLLITHPTATFFWRVRGTSMQGAGITDGDILVVNRALQPRHGDVVVAEVDNDFTVKYLFRRNGRIKLQAADPTFPDLVFERPDGPRLVIVGVVTSTIKRFR